MAETMLTLAVWLSLAAWIYLLLFRGWFWRCDQFLPATSEEGLGENTAWPDVIAIIPARNEADNVGETVAAHLAQDYPGRYHIILVNDQRTDATAARAAAASGGNSAFHIVEGRPLPEDWNGKLWALQGGIAAAADLAPSAKYFLFTDADIRHVPGTVRNLVARAEAGKLVLVSQMVQLRCRSFWEKLLIPAFVFYFQMLYPFRWVNDPSRATAAGAGGCMLVYRDALVRAGGLDRIRNHIIDDCALAQILKPTGAIWLGLGPDSDSLRAYERLSDIWSMVTRTAYVQLSYSALLLAATVATMVVIYLLPPVSVFLGWELGRSPLLLSGLAAWASMSASYLPTLKLYGQPAWTSIFMPVSALLYTLMTIDSARKFLTGKPPSWRDRQVITPPAEAER